MPQLKVQDYYTPTITAFTGALGDATFTLSVAPTYSYGYIVLAADNINLREIVYYHDKVGNTISVRAENRGLGGTTPKQHGVKENCAMKDVAEIFNFFSDNLSQCFNVEKTGGLTIKVWGGTVFYNGVPVTVADTNLTLANNTTNYIKYSYPLNTVSFDGANVGNIKAIVITSGGVITSITYKVAKESYIDFTVAITGALPPQAGNAGKFLQTDSTNVSWQSVVIPDASTTVAGRVEIATQTEVSNGAPSGGTGAVLSVNAGQLSVYGNGSDGDVVISVDTTLVRDMYYNNLTINSTKNLITGPYKVYVLGTLTNNGDIRITSTGAGGTGGAGGNASSGVAGTGGTGGVSGNGTNGSAGGNGVVNSFPGAVGVAGGNNGSIAYMNATSAGGGAAGAAGIPGALGGATATTTRGSLYNVAYNIYDVLRILLFPSGGFSNPIAAYVHGPTASGGAGGGGTSSATAAGGGGGGGGGSGGLLLLFARTLVGSGTITINGGAGGAGGNGFAGGGTGAGGGGGGGGTGGVCVLVYNSGTPYTVSNSGGAGGAGGTGTNNGVAGTAGAAGASVLIVV